MLPPVSLVSLPAGPDESLPDVDSPAESLELLPPPLEPLPPLVLAPEPPLVLAPEPPLLLVPEPPLVLWPLAPLFVAVELVLPVVPVDVVVLVWACVVESV